MKKISILFILVLLFVRIFAQEEIYLYDGSAPGSEAWDWNEQEYKIEAIDTRLIYNVVKPTLTVFKPEESIINGTSIVICPGGGFQFLAIDHEGYEVARWLNSKGITAFVLKYRVAHSLTDNPMQEFMEKQSDTDKFNEEVKPIVGFGIADGRAAIAYVREHAAEYGLSPNKIGIIGFSAGGTVTAGTAFTYKERERPDFVAPIYPYVGSFDKPVVPQDAPPMFILAATDDMFGFQKHCIDLYSEWENAGKSVELHIYAKGDHGFGMNKKDLPVDTWIERFADWLHMQGFIE